MDKELNIYKRMSNATNEIQTVAKNLNVQVSDKNTYKAVGEKDILDAVKPIEFKHGIYSYPLKRTVLVNEVLETESRYGTKKQIHYLIETVYRFVNVDNSNDYIETISYSDGIDTGDKAMGKAMTYGDKYALMKAYKISTGEDPDKESSEAMNNLIIEYTRLRGQLEDLGCDFRDEATDKWVCNKAKIETQDLPSLGLKELRRLCKVYAEMIDKKKNDKVTKK